MMDNKIEVSEYDIIPSTTLPPSISGIPDWCVTRVQDLCCRRGIEGSTTQDFPFRFRRKEQLSSRTVLEMLNFWHPKEILFEIWSPHSDIAMPISCTMRTVACGQDPRVCSSRGLNTKSRRNQTQECFTATAIRVLESLRY